MKSFLEDDLPRLLLFSDMGHRGLYLCRQLASQPVVGVAQNVKGVQAVHAVPIFEKDGNEFFVLNPGYLGADREEAMGIGWGASLVECILLGMKFTGNVLELYIENSEFCHPHVKYELGPETVCVIAGTLFEEAEAELNG